MLSMIDGMIFSDLANYLEKQTDSLRNRPFPVGAVLLLPEYKYS